MNKTTAVLTGAGFSAVSRVPLTDEITSKFLDPPHSQRLPGVQQEISRLLTEFWRTVFGYFPNGQPPNFEDHFTLLDLAANSGHHLGKEYPPYKLRAIRRLSIHRVFEVLDQFSHNSCVAEFLGRLAGASNHTLISTNWDVASEKHLRPNKFKYGGGILAHPTVRFRPKQGLSILKLHGSSNWLYCDSCQRTFFGPRNTGKTALQHHAFLESRDFELLNSPNSICDLVRSLQPERLRCPDCDIELTARVATFSYSKALGFTQFSHVWAEALNALRRADRWIFIGYSLPESDYYLRHMLKAAELARGDNQPEIIVVTKGAGDIARYKRFFGSSIIEVETGGFLKWWSKAGRRVGFR